MMLFCNNFYFVFFFVIYESNIFNYSDDVYVYIKLFHERKDLMRLN